MSTITGHINVVEDDFKNTVHELIRKYPVDEIIETGTYNGLGSTKIFADTLKPVITLESCYEHYIAAKQNLNSYNNVACLYASSLDLEEMKYFIQNDIIYDFSEVLNNQILTDNTQPNCIINPENIKNFYINEIYGFNDKPCPTTDILLKLIDNYKNQIVFLDSAGGVGFLEYQKFMSLSQDKLQHKILILDDIWHVKHYRSFLELKGNGYNIITTNRFGYCVFNKELL